MSSPVPPARLHPREWLLLGRKTWFSWCLMLLNLPLQKILLQSWLWSFSISMLHACYMKQRSSKFWLPAHSAEQKIHEKTVSQGCYQKESLAAHGDIPATADSVQALTSILARFGLEISLWDCTIRLQPIAIKSIRVYQVLISSNVGKTMINHPPNHQKIV